MSSEGIPNLGTNYLPDVIGAKPLSVVLIGPDETKRQAMATALAEIPLVNFCEFLYYPTRLDNLQRLLDQSFDVVMLDLDSDPDIAFDLVEKFGANDAVTVMVYSEKADTKQAVRYMRAGAREYLLLPLEHNVLEDALTRTAAIHQEKALPRQRTRPLEEMQGSLLVLLSAKGGSGVTTVAGNLAIALAQEVKRKTLLIDLALPIGDAALSLGITADFSTDDAFRNADRLDMLLLQEMLVKHKSGLFVLAAPSQVPEVEASQFDIERLIAAARRGFDHVVVDLGSRVDVSSTALFKEATTVYLVTLTGVSELRNSSRLITKFFGADGPNLEVVINRFESKLLGAVSEDVVTKALGKPVRWKIPEDQDAAREMQFGRMGAKATRISRVSAEIASSITGVHFPQKKQKKNFELKSFSRIATEDIAGNDDPPSLSIVPPVIVQPIIERATPTIIWPNPDPIPYGTPVGESQLCATASVHGTFDYSPAAGASLPAGTQKLTVTFSPTDSEKYTSAKYMVSIDVARDVPTIDWPKPKAIKFGTPLNATQLCAAASVPGSFDYSPASGEVLGVGTQTLSVSFTPTDSANYEATQATVSLKVAKATPTVDWSDPDPIAFGVLLGAKQLCATAPVPGTFEYSHSPGEELQAGAHSLAVMFIPADGANYATTQATVSLKVAKATPTIDWPTPQPIECGTPLNSRQLCAKATVPGSFSYSPARGEVLAAGKHTLSATFTPADRANYATVKAVVSINVARAVPSIEWSDPAPIMFGTVLSARQLCATTPVPGTFEYSHSHGEQLPVGTHAISVIFTPTDRADYATVQSTVSLTVKAKAMPTVSWSNPDPITCGTLLSDKQLSATASVPGTFDYSAASGEVLAAGNHTLTVTFTPNDSENYTTAMAAVSLTVKAKTIPVVAWQDPEPITYGTLLSTRQLCAVSSVAGTFNYSHSPGDKLATGTHKLSATFTPTDCKNYATAESNVSLQVAKAVPVIAWPTPAPIMDDTPLSTRQLCSTASVPGTFDYSPALGELPGAGIHTLSVTFNPTDSANYTTAEADVSLTVKAKEIPIVAWPSPESITYGTVLSAEQLCAATSVPGTFDYSHSPGDMLAAGTHKLFATFTPTDSKNYATTETHVSLKVSKALPVITWPIPSPVMDETFLSATQLCATATVPGTFEYFPPPGVAPPPGTHTLSVTFTPADSASYAKAKATVSLIVNAKAVPVVEWPNPEPITYGTPLSSTQLSAAASVPGTFNYSPALGTMLPAGTQRLSVTFTPEDSENSATVKASAKLIVGKVTPAILWPNPEPITYGTPVGAKQLCATASVPGTFDYSPARGAMLPSGTHKLSVTFTPADSENYTSAKSIVSIDVAMAAPTLDWPKPKSIQHGTLLDNTQLCATAPVPGTFDYSPAPGEMLGAGTHALSVRFTPKDSSNYATSHDSVSLEVVKAKSAIVWPNPNPIEFGTLLGENQLCAVASAAGTLDYSPAPGDVLPAGSHTLLVNFTPADSVNYEAAEATVPLKVVKATPVIDWPTPQPIQCGTPLDSTHLCAKASVPGTFDYSHSAGEVLPAGTHTLSLTFIPEDRTNIATAHASVPLNVARAAVVIAWSKPAPITFGELLSTEHFYATAQVPGKFDYSHSPGEQLPAGTHTLSVLFTPADGANYSTTKATVPLIVAKATPSIDWPIPEAITCDMLLGNKQLCATASVPGTFDYYPAPGEVLPAGTHALSVAFTPTDSANYAELQASVPLEVSMVKPSIDWPKPKPIICGTAIGAAQLRAAAWVPGIFAYSPAAGEVLPQGAHTLSVTFIPADRGSYAPVQATVQLDVLARATPAISWPKPKPITYGMRISSTQLNATASVPGTFEYFPAEGEMLAAGKHTLSLVFTPTDGANYAAAKATVALSVAKATPTVAWPDPNPIPYGTPLGTGHLNATASHPGTFEYSPEPGDVLQAGTHTLSVVFTPTDSVNYSTARASVALIVAQQIPLVDWPTPKPIKCGTPLSAKQLGAVASIPGTFEYCPLRGEVLPEGTHTLSLMFIPSDVETYSTVQATTELEVEPLPDYSRWFRIAGVVSACLILLVLIYMSPQLISESKSLSNRVMGSIASEQTQLANPVPPSNQATLSASAATKLLIHKTKPIYPAEAKRDRVSGTVELDAIISETGKIKELHAINGPALLQQAALNAVWTWRYKPFKLNDVPTEVETTIKVNFSLGG